MEQQEAIPSSCSRQGKGRVSSLLGPRHVGNGAVSRSPGSVTLVTRVTGNGSGDEV